MSGILTKSHEQANLHITPTTRHLLVLSNSYDNVRTTIHHRRTGRSEQKLFPLRLQRSKYHSFSLFTTISNTLAGLLASQKASERLPRAFGDKACSPFRNLARKTLLSHAFLFHYFYRKGSSDLNGKRRRKFKYHEQKISELERALGKGQT